MISIVHPLTDELLGLVATGPLDGPTAAEPRDTSWQWLLIGVAVIGVLAWATR